MSLCQLHSIDSNSKSLNLFLTKLLFTDETFKCKWNSKSHIHTSYGLEYCRPNTLASAQIISNNSDSRLIFLQKDDIVESSISPHRKSYNSIQDLCDLFLKIINSHASIFSEYSIYPIDSTLYLTLYDESDDRLLYTSNFTFTRNTKCYVKQLKLYFSMCVAFQLQNTKRQNAINIKNKRKIIKHDCLFPPRIGGLLQYYLGYEYYQFHDLCISKQFFFDFIVFLVRYSSDINIDQFLEGINNVDNDNLLHSKLYALINHIQNEV